MVVLTSATISPILELQGAGTPEYFLRSIFMDKKFDPEKIALAIVASSSYQLSISEKIELYMGAYDEACEVLSEYEANNL